MTRSLFPAPLRRIIVRDEVGPGAMIRERLECGHSYWPTGDVMTYRRPLRRRCDQCTPGSAPIAQGTQIEIFEPQAGRSTR